MKYKIRETGEIIDVVSYSGLASTERDEIEDWIDYIDSNGNEIKHAQLNIYWDLEPITDIESTIDWEKRRYDMAKDFTAVMLGRLNYDPFTDRVCCCCSDGEPINPYTYIANIAIRIADALTDELNKGGTDERKNTEIYS